MAEFVSLADVNAAQKRIAKAAVRTPLVKLDAERVRAAGFTEIADTMPEIWLKDESKQPIGSFKLRGAFNKIAQLSDYQLRRGVITYSSGNHAQGVAYAARELGSKAVIVMPSNAPAIKKAATAALGAEIVEVGPASSDRKVKAEELEMEFGYTMVTPYDDPNIIAGQATCGLEIMQQLPEVELVLSPVSGGGLLSGVATGVKLSTAKAAKQPQVWGCEPQLAGDAAESFATKALVEWPAAKTTRTIADGLRTQSLGVMNFAHILRHVDGILTVTEDEILAATKLLLLASDIVPEPSGAVTLAAALFHAEQLPQAAKIVVIVSGGNIDPALKAELVGEAAVAAV